MVVKVSKKTLFISIGVLILVVPLLFLLYVYLYSQKSSLRCDTFKERYPGINCGLYSVSPDETLYQFVGVLRGVSFRNNEAYLTVEMKDKKGQKAIETFVLPPPPYVVWWKKISRAKIQRKEDGNPLVQGNISDTNTPYNASELAKKITPGTEIILSVVNTPKEKLPELKKKFGNLKMFQCIPYITMVADNLSKPSLQKHITSFAYRVSTGCSVYAQLVTTF